MEEHSNREQIELKKRKRDVRHDEEYKRNIIKQNRIKGLSYKKRKSD